MNIPRFYFTIAVCLLFSVVSFAQEELPQVSEMSIRKRARFERDSARENTLLVPMDFGESDIAKKRELPDRPIRKVSIIYTDYPVGMDFTALNQRRVEALIEMYPQLADVPANKWQLIRQEGFADKAEAESRFHGAMIQWSRALRVGERAKKRMAEIEVEYIEKGNFKDSVVFRVLERHKKEWKNCLAVCDWTGSVYPYSSQILHWHKLNSGNDMIRGFTFFNDGDDTPDEDKLVGETGGIYIAGAEDLDAVLGTMLETMNGGLGGDGPENDIEAIVTGLEVYEDVEAVILIADNNSSVRDIALYQKLKKPLKIILCGTEKTELVNPAYVNLARYTGGSVHTIEEDITYLKKLDVGDTVRIAGNRFYLSDDDFLKLIEE